MLYTRRNKIQNYLGGLEKLKQNAIHQTEMQNHVRYLGNEILMQRHIMGSTTLAKLSVGKGIGIITILLYSI